MNLGIEPPKGVLLFGPPGTGKTLCARAVANRTDACFIRVIGSELVQKYVGEVILVLSVFLNLSVVPAGNGSNSTLCHSLFTYAVSLYMYVTGSKNGERVIRNGKNEKGLYYLLR